MGHRDDSPLEAGFEVFSVGVGFIRDCALNGHGLLLSLNIGGQAKPDYGGEFRSKTRDPCQSASLISFREHNDRKKTEIGTDGTLMARGEEEDFRLLSNRLQNETPIVKCSSCN